MKGPPSWLTWPALVGNTLCCVAFTYQGNAVALLFAAGSLINIYSLTAVRTADKDSTDAKPDVPEASP